ncbi:MAG: DUF4070 domain-containing protein [Spirochaetota bacterium]
MKILLVYPENPDTFWSFKNAIKFISKKSNEPPLGLLTVAAMLPEEWEKRLVDTNVTKLEDQDLKWADYVFLSAMNVHIDSIKAIIKRCNTLGAKIVAGGPLFTTEYEEFPTVDHLVLNEAEVTLPMFLKDLENGIPRHIYKSDEFPEISQTPVPMWNLLDRKKYSSMSVQYSRGCPFDCEFCSITMLNGHRPRTKTTSQLISELDALYANQWKGAVFIVDDNFIGNKKKLKSEVLPALIEWSEKKKYPFFFTTEVSINLADDDELIELMVKAGFERIFVGIETPHDESLNECGKLQNRKRNLIESVKKLQQSGLVVYGGFIVGFDHDPPSIFEQQINFIQQSGITTAMVGLLNAPNGTKLFKRLESENRLLGKIMTGDTMDSSINFIPKMNPHILVEGYRNILKTIYSPKAYYERVKTLLCEFQLQINKPLAITFADIKAFFRSIWILGFRESGKRFYWKLFFLSLFKYPKKFALAINMAIFGFHFRKIVDTI